jgi:uncharacterized membrane protein YfcA
MPVSLLELAIALVVTGLGAAIQGTVGIGFGIVSVPLLSLLNPVLAPVPQLLLAVPLAMSMAWRERSHIEHRGVIWLLLGRIPGAILGLGLLTIATARLLDVGIAASVLVAVVILGTGYTVPRTKATEFGTGVIAGVMGMVASMGGPPAALLFKDATGPTVRSTLATFFSVGLMVTVLTRAFAGKISGDDLILTLLLAPGMVAGYIVSSRFHTRVDVRIIRPTILTLSTAAAVGLLVRAAIG